ncbi:MAG: anaerobic ribonucleoside-triphosphate reductase activating protein [archaeon]
MNVNFGGIVDVSTVDYPDRVSSVVFLRGCNFRCPFCFNTDLVDGPSQEVEVDFIVDSIKKNNLIDAVVITGGEPALQSDALFELCSKFKQLGLLVKVDTNGSFPEVIKNLIDSKLVDYVALDVKSAIHPVHYSKAIGFESGVVPVRVKQTMNILASSRIDYECRCPIVPGLNDDPEVLRQQAHDVLPSKVFVLEQFTPDKGTLDPNLKAEKVSADKLNEYAKFFRNYVVKVRSYDYGEKVHLNCGCD